MTFPVRLSILLFCIFFFSGSLASGQIRTFQHTATAPILENDIAFAKHNAFLKAQHDIITAAIHELLESAVYESNLKRIYSNQIFLPKNHLVSVKIINETVEENVFSIELEAKIQMGTLIDDLKQLGLVLKSDPWIPVTLLTESGISPDIALLKTRLAPFHIEINTAEFVDFTGISIEERKEKGFIEDLFANYPGNKVIYLLENIHTASASGQSAFEDDQTADTDQMEENRDPIELINGIQLRIIRKSDLEELNTFSLKLPEAYTAGSSQLEDELAKTIPRLFSLLTVISIKRNAYESGLAASYYVEVSGLNAPYLRSAFEEQILKNRRSINHFSLVELSADTCGYIVQSSSEQDVLIEELLQANPYFELRVENKEFNAIGLSAFYQFTSTGTEPDLWIPEEKTLKKILTSLIGSSVKPEDYQSTEEEREDETAQLNSYYIPSFIEAEPNNSTSQYNRIPEAIYILGEIASRADEDIFELKGVEISDDQLEMELFPDKFAKTKTGTGPNGQISENGTKQEPDSDQQTEEARSALVKRSAVPAKSPMAVGQNATVYIDWIQIGKTSLAPQLKLYDEGFNFINAFNLVHSQKRLKFSYTFPQAVPEKIYIRISDRIGFIQGETGGFKRYQYLIRYSWKDDRLMEPEHPLAENEEQRLETVYSE